MFLLTSIKDYSYCKCGYATSSRDSGEPHLPRSRLFLQLVLPKSVEPVRCKLGVPHRVLDVLMSQVMLDRSSIMAVVGEFKPAGMAQHVRVHRKPKSRELTGPSDDLTHRGSGKRSFALGDENIRCVRVVSLQASQRTDLGPPYGVC